MKIAWGITGAGHLIGESILRIEQLAQQHQIDLFLSKAASVVLTMYNKLDYLKHLQNTIANIEQIIYEHTQTPAFPVCGRFNLHVYDVLVISPLTANTMAKIVYGIADSLISNCVAQMRKAQGTIVTVPTDRVEGPIETQIPNGEKIELIIDSLDAENCRKLEKMLNIKVLSSPSEILLNNEG